MFQEYDKPVLSYTYSSPCDKQYDYRTRIVLSLVDTREYHQNSILNLYLSRPKQGLVPNIGMPPIYVQALHLLWH